MSAFKSRGAVQRRRPLYRTMGSTDGSRLTLLCAIGPFALEQEQALLREHGIDVLIAKNSGGGAVADKLAAARQLNVPVVMLERPGLPSADRESADINVLAAALPRGWS